MCLPVLLLLLAFEYSPIDLAKWNHIVTSEARN
jgi:hypothetical protein